MSHHHARQHEVSPRIVRAVAAATVAAALTAAAGTAWAEPDQPGVAAHLQHPHEDGFQPLDMAPPEAGDHRVVRLVLGLAAKFRGRMTYELVEVNGEPAVASWLDGRFFGVAAFAAIAARKMLQSGALMRWINRGIGALFVYLGIRVALMDAR